jgi:DNA-binding MarR family transcriptional regulator
MVEQPDDRISRISDAELAARLRVAIGRLARQLRQSQPGGLTATQLSALVSLDGRGVLRLSDLAAVERVTPSTLSRIVASLEDQGLVLRSTDPDDRRSSLVEVSPRARALLSALREERTLVLAQRVAGLSRPARQALAAALPALEEMANGPAR